MLTCKVDARGRVMLPGEWRRRFNIAPSTTLAVIEDEGGSLILETCEQGVRRAQRLVAAYIEPGGRPLTDELTEERCGRREVGELGADEVPVRVRKGRA